ncbi:MAG TPA: hypothetical protein VFQ67_11700 [Allosphingosinicella sp.]|jgi:hypothetical protein|nr:hypothetical protein [Allosphingosinicella sp.]
MPETITLGHLLMLLGALALLYALWQASIFLKHASAGRGTPQYARRRDGRRYAIWGAIAAAILFALGCLTPLGEMAIA